MNMFACPQRKQLGRKQLGQCLLAMLSTLAILAAQSASQSAWAQIGSARYSSIVVDETSGNVLEAVNADEPRRPASLTKLMTLYLTFEALRDRRIQLDQAVPVSPHAASMEPTKLGLVPGTHLTVREAILGLVTKSANDAASALGELLGGSEDRFAQMMTLRARALGMSHSTFQNASGLPDPDQWTTAHDLAVLSRHIIADFPNFYTYFSTPSFAWHRQIIFNHDSMLRSYPGADGLKTGYTELSGHNLITSAVRGGVRLIGVVMGAATNGERDAHMTVLLNQGFEEMDVPISKSAPAPHITLVTTAHAAELPREMPHPPAMHGSAHLANWSVHVGTFPTQSAAHAAAAAARRDAEAGEIRIEPVRLRGKVTWRATLVGLTAEDASDACSGRRRGGCAPIKPASRLVASR
jgi:D-alanyl-D-alanine carboxypeptidase